MFYKNIRRRRKNKKKNYIFQNKFGITFWVAIFVVVVFLNAQKVIASEITSDLSAEQAGKLFELTNQSRTEQGIEKLTVNQNLTLAANNKARDMFKYSYFAHTSPQGITPWHWIRQAGYSYQYAGENLAMDFVTTEGMYKALIASATHRRNILNPHYKEIGIAVLSGNFEGRRTTIVVQMFGSPFQNIKKQNIEKQKTIVNSRLSIFKKPAINSASINSIEKFNPSINKSSGQVKQLKDTRPKSFSDLSKDINLNSKKNEKILILPVEEPFKISKEKRKQIDYLAPENIFILNFPRGLVDKMEIDSNGRIKGVFKDNMTQNNNSDKFVLMCQIFNLFDKERNFRLIFNSFKKVVSQIPEHLSCFLFGGKIEAQLKYQH